jgi:hypothetical protein
VEDTALGEALMEILSQVQSTAIFVEAHSIEVLPKGAAHRNKN